MVRVPTVFAHIRVNLVSTPKRVNSGMQRRAGMLKASSCLVLAAIYKANHVTAADCRAIKSRRAETIQVGAKS